MHSDGYDLWKHLKTFNDSFTKLHLESISMLSAIIRSIERNNQKLMTVKPQNALNGGVKDIVPFRNSPILMTDKTGK